MNMGLALAAWSHLITNPSAQKKVASKDADSHFWFDKLSCLLVDESVAKLIS
jgi:hypothetical protein